MDKITVRKRVFWNAAGKMMSGTVKQIFSSHVSVSAEGCEYIVRRACLSTSPKGIGKIAKLLTAGAAEELGIVGFEFKYDPKTGEASLKWVDPEGATMENMPCQHPSIAAADAAFRAGQEVISVEINPELWKNRKKRPVLVPQTKAVDMPVEAPKQKAPVRPLQQQIGLGA